MLFKALRVRVISVFFLIVLCSLLSHFPAEAAGQPTRGADIVFLIDQSGSMMHNDPLGLRFDGPQFAIDWLGRALLEYDQDHKYSFRVAVIDFGSFPTLILDPMEIAPQSEENWQDESSFMRKKLAPENRPELGTTEMVSAFKKVAEVYATWGAPQADRSRIIVLLTDGLPFPDPDLAMQNLEQYYTVTFPFPTYQLFVMGMSSPDSPWSLFAARWNALSHDRAQAVANRRLLGTYFQRILGQIGQDFGIQAEQITQCGMVAIAPYLDLVRFTIHNPDPQAAVKVFDADKRLLNEAATDGTAQFENQVVEVRGHQTPIESVTVYNPDPGYWRIECPLGGEGQPVILTRQVSARSQVQMPGQRLALGVPYGISFRLFDHSGKPLAQDKDPRYALDVRMSAVATRQEGEKPEEVVLRFDSISQAFQGTLLPTAAGEWVHKLVARTATPDGGERIVAEVTTPSVGVSHPLATISLPPGRVGQLVPVTLTLAMTDADGRPFVRTTEMLSAMMAEAIVIEGTQAIAISLQPTDNDLYVGSFLPYASGNHSVRGRVSLLDSTKPTPALVTDGPSVTQFVVEPPTLEAELAPARLTQLVPITVHLSLLDDQAEAFAPLADLAQWTAQISGLGQFETEVIKSAPVGNKMALTFTPKSKGEFSPEASLFLHRPGVLESAGTILQNLGTIVVSAPSVITQTVGQAAQCALEVRLLDATEQPLAKTMDQGYTLIVTARDESGSETSFVTLESQDGATYRSITSPTGGRMYRLRVEARKNNELIQLLDGIALPVPQCSLLGGTAGSRSSTLLVIVVTIVGLLVLVSVLGRRLWRKRAQNESKVIEKNPDARGVVRLEQPKGTALAERDLSIAELAVNHWNPVEAVKEGKKVPCPVKRIEIRQSAADARGDGQTGKVGAYVRPFYADNFDVFNESKWIQNGVSLELKDGWWLTFQTKHPVVSPPSGKTPTAPKPAPSHPGESNWEIPRPDSDLPSAGQTSVVPTGSTATPPVGGA